MNGYDYKYWLFSKSDPMHPRKIQSIDLDLRSYVLEKYPSLKGNPDLTPNGIVMLFNASFESNEELCKTVAELYGKNHPRFPGANEFDYVALIAEGKNAEDFGFLKYSYSKRTEEYNMERLIPIIYHSDLHEISQKKSIKFYEILEPSSLIKKILKTLNVDIDTNHSFNYRSDQIKTYEEKLELIIYNILYLKYESKEEYMPEKEKNRHYVDKDYDTLSIRTILNSYPINGKRGIDSTLYFNILSIILYHERMNSLAKEYNLEYDPHDLTMNGEKISQYNLAYTTFSSKQDYIDKRVKDLETKEALKPDVKDSDEVLRKAISEYNQSNEDYLTESDYLSAYGNYDEITQLINEYFDENNKNSQR